MARDVVGAVDDDDVTPSTPQDLREKAGGADIPGAKIPTFMAPPAAGRIYLPSLH